MLVILLFFFYFIFCTEPINKYIYSVRQICQMWRERFASFRMYVYWLTRNMSVIPNHIGFLGISFKPRETK